MVAMAFGLIGGMFGGPLGSAIFSIIGGLVMSLISGGAKTTYSHTEGQKLGDRSTPLSSFGAVIPRVWGTQRVSTNMIWFGSYVEKSTVTTQTNTPAGSKGAMMGGGGQGKSVSTTTNYYYYGSWASLICKGPICGIKRIWLNGQLVYNIDRFGSDNELAMSLDFGQHFTVFHGTDDQGPSSIIQAKEGDETPAYRGMAYIVFSDVLLERFGNRVPSVDIEVVSEGSGSIPIYETEVPLSLIIGTMLQDIGLTPDQFDVTQLSDKVKGYTDQETQPLAQKLQVLAQAYLFDVVETNGKLQFVKQPAPTQYREYNLPCMINEDGLIVNSFQDAAGRQGYFDAGSGTSEGQFTMIKACVAAWRTETDPLQKQGWHDRALFLASILEEKLYRAPVPADPSVLWVPHWLFSVKRPVQMQSWQRMNLNFSDTNASSPDVLRAVIPQEPGYWGADFGPTDSRTTFLKVYQVFATLDSYMLWDNPYSGIVGYSEVITGQGVESDGTVYVEIKKAPGYTISESFSTAITYTGAGGVGQSTVTTLIGQDTITPNSARNATIVYGVNSGPVLGTSECYEAWPHWRALDDGETACATDTLYWAADAYDYLYEMTGDVKWQQAAAADRSGILQTHAVQDGRDYFKPMYTSSAFSMSGTYDSSTRANMGPANWERDAATGIIKGNIPSNNVILNGVGKVGTAATSQTYDSEAEAEAATNPSLAGAVYQEMQFGRGISDSWRLADQYLEVKVGASKAVEQLYIYLDTAIKYGASTRWFAPLTLVGTGEIETIDLTLANFYLKDAGGTSAAATSVAGAHLSSSGGNTTWSLGSAPQNGTYSVAQSGSNNRNGENYYSVYFTPAGSSNQQLLGQMGSSTQRNTTTYSFSSTQINVTAGDPPSGSCVITGVVTAAGPTGLAGAHIYAVGFSYTGPDAMIFQIERVRPYPVINLPYTPYATPFTCNVMNGQLIEWRGSPGSGYTYPHGWAEIGDATGVQTTAQFLKDSQDAWQARKGYRGPFAPCYVWDRADTYQLPLDGEGNVPQPNTWTWSWYDPNTQWGGYKYRPLESVAHAWFMTGNTTCRDVANDFLVWLDAHWVAGGAYKGAPPTNYPEIGDPDAEYEEPHFAALIMRAAMWFDKAHMAANSGQGHTQSRSLITKAYAHLSQKFLSDLSKEMGGSFANPHSVGADPNDYSQWDWYGFWHAEIIETLSDMIDANKGQYLLSVCGMSQSTIVSWIRGGNLFLDNWTRRIPQMTVDDMGVIGESDDAKRPYTMIRKQELELPLEIEIKFSNPDLAYAADTRYARRYNVQTSEKVSYDLPMAFTGPDAEILVNRMLFIAWIRRTTWTFTLPTSYFQYDPGDVIEPVINGKVTPIFIAKASYANGLMEISGVAHDPEVYRATALTGGRTAPRLPVIGPPSDTDLYVMNLPLLQESQSGAVYYLAAAGGSTWSTGYAERSLDLSSYETGALFNTYCTMGTVITVPTDGSVTHIDRKNFMFVVLEKGELASCAESDLYNGTNACVVGEEIIQFANAEKQPNGAWLLYNLLRGRRGTEWAVNSHVAGERFVLIDPAMVAYTDNVSAINKKLFWRAITMGQNEADGLVQAFFFEGRSLKPYSPVHISATRDNDGNCTITWTRRSRIPFDWTDGDIEPPLGEDIELYSIDLLASDGTTVVDTISATQQSVVYTAAQQVAKFGGVQYWLRPVVYQISQTVGRGYAGTPAAGGV